MRTPVAFIVLLSALTACSIGGSASVRGSFMQSPVTGAEKRMATDAAKKLTEFYPPARTRFIMGHATPDEFGATLIQALRTKGYALAEFKAVPEVAKSVSTAEWALSYVVDQPRETGFYRVTLIVNHDTYSRIYSAQDGALASAGSWVRKESSNEH